MEEEVGPYRCMARPIDETGPSDGNEDPQQLEQKTQLDGEDEAAVNGRTYVDPLE